MTNFEKYKEDIINLHRKGCTSIGIQNDKPVSCIVIGGCDKCDLNKNERFAEDATTCPFKFFLWGTREYKERPKLTEREHAFCVMANTGYIARDKDGFIGYYDTKPNRNNACEAWCNGSNVFAELDWFNLKFSFITWDDEPWSIGELLQLEVEKCED